MRHESVKMKKIKYNNDRIQAIISFIFQINNNPTRKFKEYL